YSTPLSSLFAIPRPPPRSPLFPYTTLFRSYSNYDADKPLEAGMVVSIETTMLHPKRGFIKLEDTVAVTDTGWQGMGDEPRSWNRSEEHTSELQSLTNLVCRLLLEKKKNI